MSTQTVKLNNDEVQKRLVERKAHHLVISIVHNKVTLMLSAH